ncbi:hypothetical protein SISNIDRAFT_471877, partial [Sistotremastrum niveocremeum HHB9708]
FNIANHYVELKDENGKPARGALQIFTDFEWENLNLNDKLEISGRQHILVICNSLSRSPVNPEDFGQTLDDYGINPDGFYEADDLCLHEHENGEEAFKMKRMAPIRLLQDPRYILSIPELPVMRQETLPRCFRYGPSSIWTTLFTQSHSPLVGKMNWLLASSAGATTDKRMDANAAATFIHLLLGEKICFVSQKTANPKDASNDSHPMIGFIMRRGDRL